MFDRILSLILLISKTINIMARFKLVDYDTDDASVESSVASSDGSCSLDFSIDGDASIHDDNFSSDDETTVASGESSLDFSIDRDAFIHDDNFSSDNETRVASGESSIEDSILDDDNDVDVDVDDVDDVLDLPPVSVVAIDVVDIVPPRRSSRSRRAPIRFADEYVKYYC